MAASLSMRETPELSVNNISRGGGDLSLLGAFMTSMEEQRVLYSTHGFEYTLKEEEYFNNQRIIAAGGTPVATLDTGAELGLGAYTRFADAAYLDSFASTASDESKTQAQRHARAIEADSRNTKLKEMKAKYPSAGILDMEELLANTTQYGMEVSKKASHRSGLMQGVAGFVGGIAPAFDPRVNPGTFGLNMLGGGGKTFIAKMLTEAGLGSAVAAIDEFTGVRHNMELFGIPASNEQTAMNIALGAAAPVALHGIARGIRRIVRGKEALPPPPAAERPPASIPDAAPVPHDTSAGRPVPPITPGEQEILNRYAPADRFRIGPALDHTSRQVDTWGLVPEDMTPPSGEMGPSVRFKAFDAVDPNWLDSAATPTPEQKLGKAGMATLGDAARALDPDAFKTMDHAVQQLTDAQDDLARAVAMNADAVAGKTTTLDQAIEAAQAALKKAKGKEVQFAEAKLRALVGRRDPAVRKRARPLGTKLLAQVVADRTAKVEAAKPNVQVALARASKAWDLGRTQRQAVNDAIDQAIKKGEPVAYNKVSRSGPVQTPNRTQGLPELATEPSKPGENFTQVVARAQDAKDKALPKLVEDMKTSLKRTLADIDKLAEAKGKDKEELAKTMDFTIPGTSVDLRDLLNYKLVDGKTTISVRRMLDDLVNDNEALLKIESCAAR